MHPFLSCEQLFNLFDHFRISWEKSPFRGYLTSKQTSIEDEFYHGACHYFSTALAYVLGLDACRILNLIARDSENDVFIHSVLLYRPLYDIADPTSAISLDDTGILAFDIQSPDGRAYQILARESPVLHP